MTSTRVPAGTSLSVPAPDVLGALSSRESSKAKLLGLLLAVSVSYQWGLCFLDNQGLYVSPASIALSEIILLGLCIPFLSLKQVSLTAVAATILLFGALFILAIARGGYLDIKGLRDLMVPLVFVWLGRSVTLGRGDIDRIIFPLVWVVVVIALVETFSFDFYNQFFNTFNYYARSGVIGESAIPTIAGQTVTLNGLRPEGIGRTLLPEMLGPLRAASVFLEPVSFGNFAIIVAGWGLARQWDEWRAGALFLLASVTMIVLADSRFGLSAILVLILARLVLRGRANYLVFFAPFIAVLLLILIANFKPGYGDNMHGRLTMSGQVLALFNESDLLGISGFARSFGDMGYAYIISRFGLPLLVSLWFFAFFVPVREKISMHFRTQVVLYMSMILCVSGTSFFAFKTASVLWFMVGSLFLGARKINIKD